MTYSEQRRYNTKSDYQKERQAETRISVLARKREENNKPISGQTETRSRAIQTGKFVTEALKHYIEGNEERFNSYSDKLQDLVETIYKTAKDGNASTMIELLNRLEGKVKEEIHIDHTISNHIPEQVESEQIVDRYKIEET